MWCAKCTETVLTKDYHFFCKKGIFFKKISYVIIVITKENIRKQILKRNCLLSSKGKKICTSDSITLFWSLPAQVHLEKNINSVLVIKYFSTFKPHYIISSFQHLSIHLPSDMTIHSHFSLSCYPIHTHSPPPHTHTGTTRYKGYKLPLWTHPQWNLRDMGLG